MNEPTRVADVAELVRSLLTGDSRSFVLFDLLPVGVFVIAADGRQLYANAAAKEILGRDVEPGRTAEERSSMLRVFISGTNQPYPPDQLPSMRALRGERVHVTDMEIHGPERTVIVDVAAAPIVDANGTIAGSVAAFHDVTSAARAERAYRALVERVPVGVYSVTQDGNFLLANPALRTMLGYTSEEEIAQGNLERDHVNRQQRMVFKKILEERGEIRAFESTWRRRDGATIHVSQNATVTRDAAGRIVSYEGIVEDISERKRGQEELRETRERYRQLVELSHAEAVAPHIAYGPAGPSGTHAVRPLGSATSHFDAPRQPHCGSVSQAPPGTGGVQDPEGGGGGGGGGGAG